MNINELKMSEIAEIERLSGQAFSALTDNKAPKGKLLQAVAFVINRREDPKYKFEQAGELTFEQINALITGDEADPLEQAS